MELRRSILREAKENISYIIRKRVQLFETEKWDAEKIQKFEDYICKICQKYENLQKKVEANEIVSQYEGIINTFESLIASVKDLYQELQQLNVPSIDNNVNNIPLKIDVVVDKIRLLYRSAQPSHLHIEKPGAIYNLEFELTLHLVNRTSISELKTIIFYMDLEHENLSNSNKVDLAVEFINYCSRNNLLSNLLDILIQERPDVDWKKPYRPIS